MENKIFRKSISFDRVFYGFDLKIGLHFYFHFKPFTGLKHAKRERERREIALQHPGAMRSRHRVRTTIKIAPQHWCCHLDRHHPRSIHLKPISSAPTLPISFSFSTQSSPVLPISSSRSHRTNDLVISISSPMTHDQSLPFPQFLITLSSSLSQFD